MKELTATEWQDELTEALEYRRRFAKEDYWDELESSYFNDARSQTALGPNVIFSEGDTLISSLTVPHPEFSILPDDPKSVATAPTVQALANRLARKEYLDLKSHVEAACLNSFLYSKAIIKVGYDSEFGWSPYYDLGTGKEPWGMTLTQFDKKGWRTEFNKIKPGYPWTQVVLPHDFLVPWGTTDDVETAPWIAFRIIRETEFFKSDPKYKNTSRLTPNLSKADFIESYRTRNKKHRVQYRTTSSFRRSKVPVFTEAWEIHDKRTGKIIVVCFDFDKKLRDTPSALMAAIGGYPVVTSSFVKHTYSFWSTPLAYYLAPSQSELFDLALQAAKQRRLNVVKFLMLEGAMSNIELEKIRSGDVGACAKVKKMAGKRLEDVFKPFPKTTNIDIHQEAMYLRRHVREVMGNSSNQAGEFDASSRRTATETMAVQRGSETRQVRKEDVARELYSGAIRNCLLLTFRFWSRPRDILVGNEWQRFTGAQLSGRYSYQTDLLNRNVMSSAQRKMEALQMLVALSQYPNANLQALEKYVVDASNDPAFQGFFLQPKPPQGNRRMNLPMNASSQGGVGMARPSDEKRLASASTGEK